MLFRLYLEEIGLDRVYLDMFARNPRAIRAYEMAGFVETGHQYQDSETWVDMELTRERWEREQK